MVVCIHKIQVFDEVFSFLATVALVTQNVTVSSLHNSHLKGNKFFHGNHAAYQSKLSMKK